MGFNMSDDGMPIPDESGWFWAQDDAGDWLMVYWDAGLERATQVAGELGDDASLGTVLNWCGPINCPGGVFGGTTVLCDQDIVLKADRSREAILIQHADFSHCRDEHHRSKITVMSIVPREQAEAAVYGNREPASGGET